MSWFYEAASRAAREGKLSWDSGRVRVSLEMGDAKRDDADLASKLLDNDVPTIVDGDPIRFVAPTAPGRRQGGDDE